MTFEQQWIEYDYNPFLLFSANGKILSINNQAQFLLGYVEASTLFELATTYASSTFGFKTTFLDLEYGRYRFFGITVGYENEDEVGIRLYQFPSFQFNKPKELTERVNIYTLIDLCINSSSLQSNAEYIKDFDPTIPEIKLQKNLFVKLLNKAYSAVKENRQIITKLFIRIGEYVRFEGNKHLLFSIEVSAPSIDPNEQQGFELLAKDNSIYYECKNGKLCINIPMIID